MVDERPFASPLEVRLTRVSERLYLKQMELGPMQNFVYLIGDPAWPAGSELEV